jgi:hypothetical protein
MVRKKIKKKHTLLLIEGPLKKFEKIKIWIIWSIVLFALLNTIIFHYYLNNYILLSIIILIFSLLASIALTINFMIIHNYKNKSFQYSRLNDKPMDIIGTIIILVIWFIPLFLIIGNILLASTINSNFLGLNLGNSIALLSTAAAITAMLYSNHKNENRNKKQINNANDRLDKQLKNQQEGLDKQLAHNADQALLQSSTPESKKFLIKSYNILNGFSIALKKLEEERKYASYRFDIEKLESDIVDSYNGLYNLLESYLMVYGESPIPENLKKLENQLYEEIENQKAEYFILQFEMYKEEINNIKKEVAINLREYR